MEGDCTAECKTHPAKRAYDGTGYYAKVSNGYNPSYLNVKGRDKLKLVKE
jgi:UPF0176 protein